MHFANLHGWYIFFLHLFYLFGFITAKVIAPFSLIFECTSGIVEHKRAYFEF